MVTRQWRLLACAGEIPKPMYLHSAVQHGHLMMVFGGNNGKETNDSYTLDLRNNTWSRAPQPGVLAPVSAYPPSARYGHAACTFGPGDGQLLVVGGCKTNNSYHRDTHVQNLGTRQWRRLEDLPIDLAYHSLFTFQQRAYLFGSVAGTAAEDQLSSSVGLPAHSSVSQGMAVVAAHLSNDCGRDCAVRASPPLPSAPLQRLQRQELPAARVQPRHDDGQVERHARERTTATADVWRRDGHERFGPIRVW